MAWTAPMTAIAGSVFTAAQFNTHIRDNLNETAVAKATTAGTYFVGNGVNSLVERELMSDIVETAESTSSTAYTDLATPGPTVTVGTGGGALVIVTADITNDTSGQSGRMTFEVSGASTVAASDLRALRVTVAAGSANNIRASVVTSLALTGGSNTFTAKYRASGNTASFANRRLTVMPFWGGFVPTPYIGRTVHYVADDDPDYPFSCRAALVSNVWPRDPSNVPPRGTIVDLVVFDKTDTEHVPGVWFDLDKSRGTWHDDITDHPDYSGD